MGPIRNDVANDKDKETECGKHIAEVQHFVGLDYARPDNRPFCQLANLPNV